MKRISTHVSLSTLITILIFFLGTSFKFFEKIAWYDEFAHFLAGAWVAILIIWLSGKIKLPPFLRRSFKKRFFLTTIFLTLFVGLLWEAFELGLVQYLLNIYQYRSGLQPSNLDTISDLFMDIVGAGVVTRFLKK